MFSGFFSVDCQKMITKVNCIHWFSFIGFLSADYFFRFVYLIVGRDI